MYVESFDPTRESSTKADIPSCFTDPLSIKIFEPAPPEIIFPKAGRFRNAIIETFRAAHGDNNLILAKPDREAEYGICVPNTNALKLIPEFMSSNKPTVLDQAPNRNFVYLTVTLRHKNPDHPLNHSYVVQWRTHLAVVSGNIKMLDSKICVKPRNKDLIRDEYEFETDMNVSEEIGLKKLQEIYGDNLPDCIKGDPAQLAQHLYVSGISATSRTGYMGFQWRAKFEGHVLHEFSHDHTIVASPRLLSQNRNLMTLAQRFEMEDEIKGFLRPQNAAATLEDATRAMKGALHIHEGAIHLKARNAGIRTSKSSVSKAVFAETAALGNLQQTGAIPFEHWAARTTTMNDLRQLGLKTTDLFSHAKLRAGLVLLIKSLPEMGSLYPQKHEFTPNQPMPMHQTYDAA